MASQLLLLLAIALAVSAPLTAVLGTTPDYTWRVGRVGKGWELGLEWNSLITAQAPASLAASAAQSIGPHAPL